MDEPEVSEPPIRVLSRAVDTLTSVEISELSEAELPGFVLRLRREMDRIDAVFADVVTAAHRRGAGTGDGYDSTTAWLRWQAGMRTGEVHSAIDAGEVGELLPDTRSAWRAGRITTGAMRAISAARVEGFDPELQASEAELLAAATRRDMWSLQRLTAHFRTCAKRDGTLPPDRSGLRAAIVGDRLVLDGEIHGLAGETITRVLDVFTDTSSPDDDRTFSQRRADALYRICRIALDAGSDATMASLSAAVVIDWSTLLGHLSRKHPSSVAPAVDLTGRMDGGCIGPLDGAEVEAMLCDSAIGRVVVGPNSEPIDVGRQRRLFPAAIRRAIVTRDQRCRWPGCEKPPGWCEAHHTEAWEHGGDTSAATGILLCSRHHHFVHAHPTWNFDWDQVHFRVFRPDGSEVRAWIDEESDAHERYALAQ